MEATLDRLIRENKELREQIQQDKTSQFANQPLFMRKLLNQALKNAKMNNHGSLYDDFMKKAAQYMFISMGRKAYGTLQLNTPLPSISAVRRYIGKEEAIVEGELQSRFIADEIYKRNLSIYVWGAEDDTKIQERIKYDSKTNLIIGLKIPYDENAMPRMKFFSFDSPQHLQLYVNKHKVSPYLKLISLRSLHTESSNFVLAMYGTDLKDESKHVMTRWSYIKASLSSVGLTLLGKFKNMFLFSRFSQY